MMLPDCMDMALHLKISFFLDETKEQKKKLSFILLLHVHSSSQSVPYLVWLGVLFCVVLIPCSTARRDLMLLSLYAPCSALTAMQLLSLCQPRPVASVFLLFRLGCFQPCLFLI